MVVYLIGSLRSPRVPEVAKALREAGHEVFDDWYAAGPEADDYWQKYEQGRGRTYPEALEGYAVNNVCSFDRRHLDRCDVAVLVMPAGKSGHLELGYVLGKPKPGYILLEKEPDRWDAMYRLATGIHYTTEALIEDLSRVKLQEPRENEACPLCTRGVGAHNHVHVA